MKKLYSLLFALLAFAGMAGAQVTFDFLNNNLDLPVSYNDDNDKTTQDLGNVSVIEHEGVTITFDKGSAGTTSRLWNTGSEITLRVYKGSTFTVSAEQNIVNITFTGQASKFGCKSDPEGLNGQVWTGSAKSVTFSPTATCQIRSIIVSFEGGDTPEPQPTIDWTSSASAPLTVAQVLEKAAQLEEGADSGKDVYVKGKISQIDEVSPKLEDGSGYGNATYFISDNGSTDNQFQVFRGKYLKGADFTAEDQIKVGDEVVIVGFVKNHGGTLEFNQGNRIYSLNGDTGGDDPQPGDAKTIAEVIAGGAASAVVTSGTVFAECPNGILIGDGTGYIFVYRATAAVGDVVKVTGNVSQYGGCFQFGQGSTAEKTGTATVTYPTAKEIDGAGLDALIEAPVVTYVKVKGKLTISGNYKNLEVEGATNKGSLQVSDAVLGDAGDGDEVEVTGFFIYKSGSSTVYGNILATEVKVVGEGPAPTVTEYTKIADVKAAATTDHAKAAFQATDLLVTYVNGKSVYVFDGTDGLLLFASDAKLAEGIKAGDKITAKFTGDLYLYNGLTEIAFTEVADLTVNSSDNAVEPQKVTIADVNNNQKDYENELVQIEGLTAQAEALASRNITFMDDSDNEITVRDNWNVLTTTTFDTTTPYTVTAFVALYNGAVQLYPRSAEDVDNGVEPIPYELAGEGTLEKPYTVEDVQYLINAEDCPKEPVWVSGYIMGAAKSSMSNIVSVQGEELQATNIVLADDAAETSGANMIPVQLPFNKDESKNIRGKLNLVDNFDNLGKQVWVLGTIEKYFSVAGVKNVTDYSLDGESTFVNAVKADATKAAIYNIAGQRVSAVGKGLYVVGDKKVLAE